MSNPFDPTYLTEFSATFGPLAWAFFILQVAGLAAGAYFRFIYSDSNALRKKLLGQLGLALMIAGGVGVVLGALRLGNVAVFSQRFWFYLLMLAEVGLAGYVVYYARFVYPRQLAASASTSRGKAPGMRQAKPHAVSNQPAHNGKSHTTAHDPAATRSRRDARRERKRKSR